MTIHEAGGYLLAFRTPLEVLHLHQGHAQVTPSGSHHGLQLFGGQEQTNRWVKAVNFTTRI